MLDSMNLGALPALVSTNATLLQEAAYDEHFTLITNYVAFMGYTVLVWDHIVTFDTEIQYIWMKIIAASSSQRPLLFFFLLVGLVSHPAGDLLLMFAVQNRYFTPLAFIGNFAAYLGGWSAEHCSHFVRYEGACTMIALAVAEIILFFRVRALYWQNKLVPFVLGVVWLAQQVVAIWLLTHGREVQHEEHSDRSCTMIFTGLSPFPPSLSAWFPLLYDTIIISLVLYKCIPEKKTSASHILNTLITDGIAYYVVLCAINFVLGVMIIKAPDATKNVAAQLEQLLTVAMISRITLSLQREADRGLNEEDPIDEPPDNFGDKGKARERDSDDIELAEPYPSGSRRQVSDTERVGGIPPDGDDGSGSIGSAPQQDHISVVAVSPRTQSMVTRPSEVESMAESEVTRVGPVLQRVGTTAESTRTGLNPGVNTPATARRRIIDDNGSVHSTLGAPTMAESLGVISISPRHTDEAADAAARFWGPGQSRAAPQSQQVASSSQITLDGNRIPPVPQRRPELQQSTIPEDNAFRR